MSILIKGMEMPKSCSECFVKSCKWRAQNDRVMVSRSPDCPLVPVPPHGRLIDADAMFREGFGDCYGCPYDSCVLSDTPTIIPADKEGK